MCFRVPHCIEKYPSLLSRTIHPFALQKIGCVRSLRNNLIDIFSTFVWSGVDLSIDLTPYLRLYGWWSAAVTCILHIERREPVEHSILADLGALMPRTFVLQPSYSRRLWEGRAMGGSKSKPKYGVYYWVGFVTLARLTRQSQLCF